MWDLLPDPARTRAFLRAKIQTEGLRAYLISSYAHFDSLSLSALAERFDLPPNETHAIVSKMLLDGAPPAELALPASLAEHVQDTSRTRLCHAP